MQVPLQISCRHFETSEVLNTRVQEKVDELERFYPKITGCNVVIDLGSTHHRKGKGAHFHVRIELIVPGDVLVVSRDAPLHHQNEDAYAATNEAFKEMRRRLQDYSHRQRHDVKTSHTFSNDNLPLS